MHSSPRRHSAVALASVLALAAAALLHPVTAGAADAKSLVTIADPAGDTPQGSGTNNDKADILGSSARYQNGYVTLTMKVAKADDLSNPQSYLWWNMNDPGDTWASIASVRKGSDGFLHVIMAQPPDVPSPSDNSKDCRGSGASLDVGLGTYIVSLPASCISPDPIASFTWVANRQIPADGAMATAKDRAPDGAAADAVTNAKTTGYWAIGSDGKVYPFGDAGKTGETASPSLSMVDIDAAPHGTGYWALDDKGVVTAFGPVHYGNVTDLKAGEKAVSLSSTPTGAGYWVFTNKGRAIAFGDADKNLGDVSKLPLNADILDSAAMPSGKGYFLVAADGGVFALGDAKFQGSMADTKLNKPVLSIVPDPDGEGYWLVASDGGVFAFKAPFRGSTGSMKLQKPMTGMVPFGNGYLMVAEDGGVFNYSDKAFSGSLGNNPPANPIVSITALS